MDLVSAVGPLLVAALTVLVVDRSSSRRALQPPGLRPGGAPGWPWRRLATSIGLLVALYLVVFQPLSAVGGELDVDLSRVSTWQLFLGHLVLATAVAIWCLAGFAGAATLPARLLPRVYAGQLGLVARRPAIEIGLGLLVGVFAWVVVLTAMLLVTFALAAAGASWLVPREAPAAIVLLGSLAWWLRLALSLSAGVVEEIFFRGFLQPRAGVAVSTALFVLAHLGYRQPLMLVGVTLLSLCFAALAAWRQSVWAAVVAHTTFDAIQLLWIVPQALAAQGS